MGRSWFSTKYTRAPLEVCQCWIETCAWTEAVLAASAAAASHRTMRLRHWTMQLLWRMAQAGRRGRRPLSFERLWIEMGDGEGILDVVLARDLAHLLGRDCAQLLQLQIDRAVRDAAHFE